jgi:hypothetical protein
MLDSQFLKRQFKDIMQETLERQGWQLPQQVTDYAVNILTEYADRNPWEPEPSYAECYMTVKDTAAVLALGNVCWWTRSVFPDLKQRRGIDSSYYVLLGTGCYSRVLNTVHNATLQHMHDHFEFLAEVAHTAIWSRGGFRSMWSD